MIATSLIKIDFLGERCEFPESLNEYVKYSDYFEKVNRRLMQLLLESSKNGEWDYQEEYNDLMKKEGEKIVEILSDKGIYNVTIDELVSENEGYQYLNQILKECFEEMKQILIDSFEQWVGDYYSALNVAESKVTGSGITVFSNSLLTHMTFAAFEGSVIKKQSIKAENDYINTMSAINLKSETEQDEKENELIYGKIYPETANAINQFTLKLMDKYLEILFINGLFDYESTKQYDITRSMNLLKNLDVVKDKKSVLIEAFKACPYNPDVYYRTIELRYPDETILKAAKFYHQDKSLIEPLEKNIYDNKSNIEQSDTLLKTLAKLKDISLNQAKINIYSDELNHVKTKILLLQQQLKHENISSIYQSLNFNSNNYKSDDIRAYIDRFIGKTELFRLKKMFGNQALNLALERDNIDSETFLTNLSFELEKKLLLESDKIKKTNKKIEEINKKINTLQGVVLANKYKLFGEGRKLREQAVIDIDQLTKELKSLEK